MRCPLMIMWKMVGRWGGGKCDKDAGWCGEF